ncbi:ferredoxin [Marinifilum sp. RC60d5]|uniref:ferredoxin n=1 Tax=Marinifilum sp. RC60d5 TaxID=3458414 RepID=UPI004036FFEC
MKTSVDKETCIGCGICESICPKVFEMKDDGKSHVKINPVPSDCEDCALEAENECPVEAISHED